MAESRRGLAPALEDEVAATGAAELDQVLGGLSWGDNVVFEVAHGATVAPFYRAIAASNVAYDQRLFIVLEGASATYPGFDLIDATPNSKLAEPAPLLHAVRALPGQRVDAHEERSGAIRAASHDAHPPPARTRET